MSNPDTKNAGAASPTPERIMQLGMGFMASKTLLGGVRVEHLAGPASMVIGIK